MVLYADDVGAVRTHVDVDFDAAIRRLTLRLSGFWSDETMTGVEEALKRKFVEATPHGTLSDASDFPV